jgi:hypothetical protein
MSETIKDGKGRGYLAEVNSNHQLMTDTVTQREESYIADNFGQTYVVSTKAITLNSTNRHVLLYLKNTSPTRKLYHATLEIGYNGGSTNYNRSMKLQILAGFTGPTANHETATISNVNFTSANVAEATSYIWDGVGDGMTIAGGLSINEGVFTASHQVFETHGMPIMGLNDYMALAVEPEEIGIVSVSIRLFFK